MSTDIWGLTGGEEIAPGLVVLKDLGGGVAYEVWLAHDERLLAPVVVKILRPSKVDDVDTRLSFDREVALLSRLNHPGLTRLFAYDDEGERPYLVLEHVEGTTLSQQIGRFGALSAHQLYAVALELASSLHYLDQFATLRNCSSKFLGRNVMTVYLDVMTWFVTKTCSFFTLCFLS